MLVPPDPSDFSFVPVSEGTPEPSPPYDPASEALSRRYLHRSAGGDLEVLVWTHAGTAWVCLRGLLNRRAARALATLFTSPDARDASEVVLNTAELRLPPSTGGTPLVTLCATLRCRGYDVSVVGPEVEDLDAEAAAVRRSTLSLVTRG